MLYIRIAPNQLMVTYGNDISQVMFIDTEKESFLRNAPHFEWKYEADWRAAAQKSAPQEVEQDSEVNQLVQKILTAIDEEAAFQQEMSDIDWQMERAIHGSWYGSNSSLHKN